MCIWAQALISACFYTDKYSTMAINKYFTAQRNTNNIYVPYNSCVFIVKLIVGMVAEVRDINMNM